MMYWVHLPSDHDQTWYPKRWLSCKNDHISGFLVRLFDQKVVKSDRLSRSWLVNLRLTGNVGRQGSDTAFIFRQIRKIEKNFCSVRLHFKCCLQKLSLLFPLSIYAYSFFLLWPLSLRKKMSAVGWLVLMFSAKRRCQWRWMCNLPWNYSAAKCVREFVIQNLGNHCAILAADVWNILASPAMMDFGRISQATMFCRQIRIPRRFLMYAGD